MSCYYVKANEFLNFRVLGGIAVFFKEKISLLPEMFVGKWVKESTFAEVKSVNPYAVHVVFPTALICLTLEDMVRKRLTCCKPVVSHYNSFWSPRKYVVINWPKGTKGNCSSRCAPRF